MNGGGHMKKKQQFEEMQWSVFQEIGTIGTGNAVSALSKLVDRKIIMETPKTKLIPFNEIAEMVGGTEEIIYSIYQRVEGTIAADIFFILHKESVEQLTEKTLNKVNIIERDEELKLSTITEIGNILSGCYLSAVSNFFEKPIYISTPQTVEDMAGAILTHGITKYASYGEEALVVETKFHLNHEPTNGFFVFIPDPETIEKIYQLLGENRNESN